MKYHHAEAVAAAQSDFVMNETTTPVGAVLRRGRPRALVRINLKVLRVIFTGLLGLMVSSPWLLAGDGPVFNTTVRALKDEFYNPARQILDTQARFVEVLNRGDTLLLLYERSQQSDSQEKSISIFLREWSLAEGIGEEQELVPGLSFASQNIPLLFSALIDEQGRLVVSAKKDAYSIEILRQRRAGSDYSLDLLAQIKSDINVSRSVLKQRPDHSFVLLGTRSADANASNQGAVQLPNIAFSKSPDGVEWTPIALIPTQQTLNQNINPNFAASEKRDFVVWQSHDSNLKDANGQAMAGDQIWGVYSDDKGLTWSQPISLVDFYNPGDEVDKISGTYRYDNQLPDLHWDVDHLVMAWERGAGTRTAVVQSYDRNLKPLANSFSSIDIKKLSAGSAVAAPKWMRQGNDQYLVWYDPNNAHGTVYASYFSAGSWISIAESGGIVGAAYPAWGFLGHKLYLFFHANEYNAAGDPTGRSFLSYKSPNLSTGDFSLTAQDFTNGKKGSQTRVHIGVSSANPDIVASSWVVTQNSGADVPLSGNSGAAGPQTIDLHKDGVWYIRMRVQDKAGNWSAVNTLSYELDTVPPNPVKFRAPDLDEQGYLSSNTYAISWDAPPDKDLDHYEYSLQYLGSVGIADVLAHPVSARGLPMTGSGKETSVGANNTENGAYFLSVWPVDDVGNKGEPKGIYFFADKYIPSTRIAFINLQENILGQNELVVSGRGFTTNGYLDQIIFDRDGVEPWDDVYSLDKGDYTILDDTTVSGLILRNMPTGDYRFIVHHTERGISYSDRIFSLHERGIMKFGDFYLTPNWDARLLEGGARSISGVQGLILVLIAFLLLSIFGAALGIRSVRRDALLLEETARALIKGTISPLWDKRKVQRMKRQRFGLRVKFTIFFLSLVIAVVLIVAIPLATLTLSNTKEILAQGLQDRLRVVIDGMSATARTYLLDTNRYAFDFTDIPKQASTLNEVKYVTITGQSQDANQSGEFDAIWSSSDDPLKTGKGLPVDSKSVLARGLKAQTGTQGYQQGVSVIEDAVHAEIPKLRQDIEDDLKKQLGTLPQDFQDYKANIARLDKNTTEAGKAELAKSKAQRDKINEEINQVVIAAHPEVFSKPEFSPATYDEAKTDYVFYKPILARDASLDVTKAHYYYGMIRLVVSTESINTTIRETQQAILQRILLFAALALGGGFLGALVLSSIILVPIRRVLRGVNEIKDIILLDMNAQDKAFGDFFNQKILALRSHDELRTLAGTIDDMAHGLHKAAEANKDLYAGKDIQKLFIPLGKISEQGTAKGTITETAEATRYAGIEIFGYYEGAKGVSGDYFFYKRLTEDLFMAIKCDVSGKGIPAALIMVEVATLVMTYFDKWQAKENQWRQQPNLRPKKLLAPLVTNINDLVAELVGDTEKFAALIIGLINQKTGECSFCNAGDTLLKIYRAKTRSVEVIKLAVQPAAGRFKSEDFNIEFKEDKNVLNQGDILLFYTDGVEESKRYHRNPDFSMKFEEKKGRPTPQFPDGEVTLEPMAAQELGEIDGALERILEAAQSRTTYKLIKADNPVADEELIFDFSENDGSARDTILSLMAVEKVWRLIPDPKAGADNRILIDKTVDDFLKRCFKQYRNYFKYPVEGGNRAVYNEYSHMVEESQYDDLTVLAFRKK